LQVLVGAWAAYPKFAILAGVGIVIGVAFTLRALQTAFFSDASAAPAADTTAEHDAHPLEPITLHERVGAMAMMALALFIGLWPRLLLDWIIPSFDSPLFTALKKGGFR
jgi:NADH-quinone oxidoreductase subunit M